MILQHQIFGDAEFLDNPVNHALFGDIGQTNRIQAGRMGIGDINPVYQHRAGRRRTQAGDALRQFLLTIARHPGNSDNLAPFQRQGYIVQANGAAAAKGADLVKRQAVALWMGWLFVVFQQDRPSDHHLGQFAFGGLARRNRVDPPAIAQDSDAMTDFQHFMQLMRDKHQRVSIIRQLIKDAEQTINLLRGQHSRRLIQNQQSRAFIQRPQNLNPLLFADGKLPDGEMRVDFQVVNFRKFQRPLTDHIQIETKTPRRLHAQRDIFGDGQRWHQHKMLMNHPDAVLDGSLRMFDGRGFAIDEDLAFIRMIQTIKHLHQRRFAGAVFAKQRVNLARPQIKVDPVGGEYAGKSLDNAAHLKLMNPFMPGRKEIVAHVLCS